MKDKSKFTFGSISHNMNDDYLSYIQEENALLRAEVERLKLQLQLLTPNPHHGNKLGYRVDVPKPRPPPLTSHTKSISGLAANLNSQPNLRFTALNAIENGTTNGASVSQPAPVNPHAPFISNPEIRRYGRQLILPNLGIEGQKKLKSTRVLIIGAGGLGSPAGLYLAAAGIGKPSLACRIFTVPGQLGFVDHDLVEASNLHRQIIHNEAREGLPKALSAKAAVEGYVDLWARVDVSSINSFCDCHAYNLRLDSSNALELIQIYDIVLDASDNVATRYLINDACVMAGKPLVSGSALRLHGQMVVYNYKGGPCYRCLFPTPPPAETVTNCADGGVLGPVTGVIGTPSFSSVRLRLRKPTCAVCGDRPTVRALEDYAAFCGQAPTDAVLPIELLGPGQRISCIEFRDWVNLHAKVLPHLLLDVRDPVQFAICSLPNSLNIPLSQLKARLRELEETLLRISKTRVLPPSPNASPNEKAAPLVVQPVLFVVCRLGNHSQLAVTLLNQHFYGNSSPEPLVVPEAILDVVGGLYAWTRQVDDQFPVY
ncbi:hypothetical protein L0F63_002375 [Massospora cicadina]|nr:hypothetical protein L0F63_002375 [Massospora cicadina]